MTHRPRRSHRRIGSSDSISESRRRHRSPWARTPTSRRRTRGSPTSSARCAEAPNQSGKSSAPQAPRSRPRTSRPGWIGSGSSGSTRARTPPLFRAQVAAIAQRGGLSVARTAGAHDKAGIQQCLDAGVDMVLVPYINTVEEAKESIRHCLFAPQGDRVWNGSALSRSKKSAVMFQLETSACMDALEEICRQPEMEFGIVGPGDLAMSLGLMTRDSMFGYMKADEVKWCYTLHRRDLHRRRENRRRIHAWRRPIELAVARLCDGWAFARPLGRHRPARSRS